MAAPPAAPQKAEQAVPDRARANAMSMAKEAVVARMLTGTVRTRTGVALPPGAVVELRLLDVSRADAPALTLGRTETTTSGESVAVPFALSYDPAALVAGHRYAAQATVTIDGRVAWRTTTQHPVLPGGAPAGDAGTVLVDPVR